MTEIESFIKEINAGFTSIRSAMAEGFAEVAEKTSEIHTQLGVLTERVGNIREAQKTLEKEVSDMKKIEDDVKDNTKFRKTVVKIIWIVAGVVITALTISAMSIFIQNLASR